MKILIVDDEPVARETLCQLLSAYPSHQVSTAASSAEAWALLDDPARYFDLLLLDIIMPESDGLELLVRIRETSLFNSLQVVMCSASSDRSTVARAIGLGARHYLVKPYKDGVVLGKLRQIFPDAFPELSAPVLKS